MNLFLRAMAIIAFSGIATTVSSQNLSLTEPIANESYQINTTLQFEALYQPANIDFANYLKVWNNQAGYRKLKIGNNPNQVYSPKIDVLAGGNNSMRITMKIINSDTDWNRMQIRPQAVSTNAPKLSTYIGQNPQLNTWIVFSIPIADFDPSIDFTNISYLEFPYSASAGAFEVLIGEIAFTGGDSEYIWLGKDELNIHNGSGGPGEVNAQWSTGNSTANETPVVQFWLDDKFLGSDDGSPFQIDWTAQITGSYTLQAKALINQELIAESDPVTFSIVDQSINFPDVEWINNTVSAQMPLDTELRFKGTITGDHTGFEMQLINNGTVVESSTQSPFELNLTMTELGTNSISIQLTHESGQYKIIREAEIQVTQVCASENAQIVSPQDGQIVNQSSQLEISGEYNPQQEEYAYMHVTNPGSGYRKLKIANNPYNIWSPKLNLLEGGNTQLEIILKDIDSNCNWERIFIAPQEIMTNAFNLQSYYHSAELLANGWRKMIIPLSAFDQSINFTSIAYLAFPYSKSAGNFNIAIRSIKFTGGSSPYNWFGGDKLDNRNDGFGNPGQLSASIFDPAVNVPLPVRASLYVNNVFQEDIASATPSFMFTPEQEGVISLQVYFLFEDGHLESTSAVNIMSQSAANPEDIIEVLLHFNQKPDNFDLWKTALKYNKDFAYSFTFDDGLITGYSNGYMFINGGVADANGVDYPGISFTNGNGEQIKASAGLAWYSANSSGSDIHINTPSYITWTQLIEVLGAGWDVFNHSYTHDAYSGTDYEAEVRLNNETVLEQTGYKMTQFVIPSGDKNYVQYALDYGMKAIYSNKSDFAGYPGGLQVANLPDMNGVSIYKRYIYDSGFTVDKLTQDFDAMAAKSKNGTHYWYNEFTHRIDLNTYSGSMTFENFRNYMQNIADKYALQGSDRMWMASLQEVYEYLQIRQDLIIEQTWEGNDLRVTFHLGSLPDDLRHRSLSLGVLASENFSTELITSGPLMDSFNQSDTTIINLSWNTDQGFGMKSSRIEGNEATMSNRVLSISTYPNPAQENIYISATMEDAVPAVLKLFSIDGKLHYQKDIYTHKGANYWKIKLTETNTQPGIYFIIVETPASRGVSRVLVK
ncbi:MAG: T9SS type A sorting domain-containing protein [Bacteroidales bacterium]|nr:T9SS type A sorting domain-containing protein [Bacteroidales bacterium]